ncbi:glycosyltransferase family A protein [Verrucomicrobium sp. BvORR106]|uniref:glycosyltransferase family 2 protein n=1 Tax=Verrucomicrobium sp. BvORR106 TaxID=1403819 RepID=UPI00069149FB|nr:glycosyltransferase family A protein [Verrucomicrobium sp. BvORR106]
MSMFTVVIPTLDRAETLVHTLQSCTVQGGDDFEILVSDNLSVDDTAQVLVEFQKTEPRLRVVRPSRRLGQATHWEFALSHAKPGFVMVLGADDALLPHCMQRARTALGHHPGVKVLSSTAGLIYFYPNAGGKEAGQLNLIDQGCRMELRDSQAGLSKLLNADCRVTDLPYPYGCAWMHTSLLDRVREATGRLIPCRTPPVFLTLACLAYTDNYVHVDPGFACPGVSAKSIGYSAQHAHGDRERDKEFFEESNIEQKDIAFHPLVGDSRAEHIHVAETILMAQEAGVLPREPAIPWPKFIALAYRDFQRGEWSESDQKSNLQSLQSVSRNMGCERIIEGALETGDISRWKKTLGFALPEYTIDGASVQVNTSAMKLEGVHEAAQLADTLLQARVDGSSGKGLSSMNLPAEYFLRWLLSSLDENRTLRAQYNARCRESDRRAAERDRAKALLVEARTQLRVVKANQPDKSKSMVSRLFGRLRKNKLSGEGGTF